MRFLLFVFVMLPSLYGCHSISKTTNPETVESKNESYTSPHIEKISDSISLGPQKHKPRIHLINKKKSWAYCVIINQYSEEVKRTDLLPEVDNYINYSNLDRGVYYFEVYDNSKIIYGGKFIHN
jgi:hypothetical protein